MNKSLIPAMLISLFCVNTTLYAQNDPCYFRKKPLSYYAFQKMMKNHYNFTILGTQAPVSGFKVETNKPTITLKGNLFSPGKNQNSSEQKSVIINLELTGGLQNDIQQIFSGKQLSGYFKGSLGINLLFDQGNNAKYTLSDDFEKMVIRKKVCEYREEVSSQIDTMLVISVIADILNAPDKSLTNAVNLAGVLSGKDEYTINNYSDPNNWHRTISYSNINDYYKKLIIEMIKKYGADASKTDDEMFKDFITRLGQKTNNTLKSSKLLADFNRASKFKNNRLYKYELIDDYEIEAYKHIWTSKRISWLNVYVTGINSSFKLYDQSVNSLTDSNSFLPSVSISYNFFKKYTQANKYVYIRTGLAAKRVNSLTDLSKFDYKKETLINVSPTETLKSEKAGTAYQGALSHGFGFDLPIEIYWAPWTHDAIPGIYGKLQYSYGEPWINKNKISTEFGMIWNLNNGEKDSKNVLTIVPYCSWTNLMKEYKDIQKTKKKNPSELFFVGLKFGIPVNLGK